VGHLLSFAVQDFSNLTAPEGPPGIILCNPPYGERLGQENELRGLYRSLGEALPKKWPGWRLCIFSGNQRLLEEVKLPIEAEFRLFNGRIPCKLVRYRAC
jgi:23S rRNA G2445 N2-methylase RlmL